VIHRRDECLLVIDPSPSVVDAIGEQLVADGFRVVHSVDGQQAIALLETLQPDLVLLELQLPKVPGLDVLREIRRLGDVPTIIVSDRATEADRIVGLEVGGDDFVAKPCSSRELLARIGAVLRRARCECGNEVLPLTATEFRILDALATHPDQTLSRSELLSLVAYDSSIYDRTLDKHVANRRKKIEVNASHPAHLLTIFGVGYRFRP
jgi:DNA-binding response OmpR family regulator